MITEEKLDEVLDKVYSREYSDEERELFLTELFPKIGTLSKFSDTNAELVTEEFIRKYSLHRRVGLTREDAAIMLHVTPTRMDSLLLGVGLDQRQHKNLLFAERRSNSAFKRHHLKIIRNAASMENPNAWRASIALLEKVMPSQYGKKLEVTSHETISMSSSDCEQRALTAKERLDKIRQERQMRKGE